MFRLLNRRESCFLYKYQIEKLISDIRYGCLDCIRRKSYYHILGLDSTASTKDIKSAYYKLSLQFHPDKNFGSSDSVAKFREITEAYEVLSNPEKKRNYDQTGDLKHHYSSANSQNGYYYKSYRGRNRYQRPFTGKTKDYDYDEHFRQHYEYEKQRQAEYEYFKRRWEADFYRRYPNREEYVRNHYKDADQHTHREYTSEDISSFFTSVKRSFFFVFVPVWCILFIAIPVFNEFHNPEKQNRRRPIYYVIKNITNNDSDGSDE